MNKIIQVHRREFLLSLDAIEGLARWLNDLSLPRRQVIEFITAILYAWIEQGGVILSGEGEVIDIYPGIVDDAHGEDGSGVWISEQRKRVGIKAAARRPRQSMLQRLQLYDAARRIHSGLSILD